MPTLALPDVTDLVTRALEQAGASRLQAAPAAAALALAEAQGLSSHGLARVPLYCAHLRAGRTDGRAEPRIASERPAAVLIDAGCGMAFAACALAVKEAIARASANGAAFAGVTNSNHFGVAAQHLMPVADAGFVGLAFGNSPAAMAAWGGKRPLFGTNPVAAVFSRRGGPPLVIDLSLSEVARGKLLVAAREKKAIPPNWALDKDGRVTTDPQAGLAGSMLPAGGVKGAMLALVVELLCVALTGAAYGFEADSFFSESGNRPRIGQAFLVVDPGALAGRGVYLERIESLIAAMLADGDVRLPGERRLRNEERARQSGVMVDDTLYEELRTLAGA